MHVIIVGTVRPFHHELAHLGMRVTLLIPRPAGIGADIKGPCHNVIVLDRHVSDDVYVDIALALHRCDPIAAVCSFHDDFQPTAAKIAAALNLPLPIDPVVVENTRNKLRMRQILAEKKIDHTPAKIVSHRQEAIALAQVWGYPLILKPIDGSGSQGVAKMASVDDIETAFNWGKASNADATFIIEPYLTGPEYSVEAISENGKHRILAITQKYKNPETFIEIGHCIPAELPNDRVAEIIAFVERVLSALGIDRGPSHTEIILTESGPKIVETHTRVGGDSIVEILEFASGIDLINLVARQSLGESVLDLIPKQIDFSMAAAVWFACPETRGNLEEIEGIKAAEQLEGIRFVRLLKQPGESLDLIRHSFMRPICAAAVGSSSSEAISRVQAAIGKLRFHVSCAGID